jgi:hypothetical protein
MVDAYLSQIRESIAQNSEVPGTFSTVHESSGLIEINHVP